MVKFLKTSVRHVGSTEIVYGSSSDTLPYSTRGKCKTLVPSWDFCTFEKGHGLISGILLLLWKLLGMLSY